MTFATCSNNVEVKDDEMDKPRSTCWKRDECIDGFDGKTRKN